MSEISKQALLIDNSQSFPNNNAGAITPANLRAFNVNMIDSLVDEIGYNVDSASWNRSINALNTFTSSQQPTFNALNSFTASQLVTNTNLNLFTQSANQELDSLSAWTGSWEAWTSSINEIRDDGVFQGYSTRFYFNGLVSASIVQNVGGPIANVTIQQDGTKLNTSSFNEYTASTAATQSIFSASVATSISQSSNTFNAFSSSQNNFNLSATASIVELLNLSSSLSGGYATQGELDQSASVLQNNINALASLTASYATTGSNSFRGVQNINSISGTGLGEVYLLGRSGSLILGNSVSTPTYAALAHLSSSQINANTNLIFKDNTLTGSTIISGSGNIFSNPADAAAGRVNYIGGTSNLFLNGQSDQLPTITGSAASISGNRPTMNGNIINGTSTWQINQATNTGLHTYSNNILGGVNQWTFNTTGNTGIVDISNNLGINSTMVLNSPSRSVAEINAGASGSNALQISNNTLAGTFTYNGPVSSSTHTITRNTIAGTTTLNLQSGSRVLNFTANVINGAVTLNDNTVFAPTLGVGNTISINNINGTFIVNQRASSSINATSNNINNWTLSNDMDASAVPAANLRFQGLANNALFGGGNNNIYTSGSAPAIASQRAFASNIFGGQNISASAVANGTDANMVATIGVGFDLHVVGTARRDASNLTGAGATQGSAFFGRYNKLGQGFNTTAEVILAVGTGTSGSAGIVRKTGLLIDSGSNVFVEGSLNVSGSLSFTGSVFGNVSASSITSQTASIDLSTANYFTLLLSGSTRINVNNPRPGVTATLVINTTTGASASFSSNVKQPSGSFYAASPSGNIDIISFTAVDSTTVYAFPAQSFV